MINIFRENNFGLCSGQYGNKVCLLPGRYEWESEIGIWAEDHNTQIKKTKMQKKKYEKNWFGKF